MCDIETVIIVAALLLAATGFCINQINSEKKVGRHSEIISEISCGKREYMMFCFERWRMLLSS